jgi:cyclopropane fatty-acyl-phospholipid synthase-like methyltransferase
VDPRHGWTVDALRLAGDERVLEIGCGPGVTASVVCECLATGSLLAIDRSVKAVSRAAARNAVHVASGRAEFRVALPEDLDERFDVVFSMNVRELWQAPERVTRLVAPGGLALWAFEPPGESLLAVRRRPRPARADRP